ncbi:hypothetical protein niasHT_010923 [Heterodera trifolii]|uniref:Uncharacterized protein n=1 Tax=Heterodera trifolii TaxID=157864 RepID=A0ABD2LG02_9BILA
MKPKQKQEQQQHNQPKIDDLLKAIGRSFDGRAKPANYNFNCWHKFNSIEFDGDGVVAVDSGSSTRQHCGG